MYSKSRNKLRKASIIMLAFYMCYAEHNNYRYLRSVHRIGTTVASEANAP